MLLDRRSILSHDIQRLRHDKVSVNVALKQIFQKTDFLVRLNRHFSALYFENSQGVQKLLFVCYLVHRSLV